MKRLLLVSVLLLCSCAENPAKESSEAKDSSLPLAVTQPPSASTEGASTRNLQDGWNATLQESMRLWQLYLDSATIDLRQSLERARISPPATGAAASTR